MTEPTNREILDRLAAAEKRAADAEALAAAAVKAAGQDTVSEISARLPSQEELQRGYDAVRQRALNIMRTSMTDGLFRQLARGEAGAPSPDAGRDALRQIVREELAAMVAEETSAAPAKPKGAQPRG